MLWNTRIIVKLEKVNVFFLLLQICAPLYFKFEICFRFRIITCERNVRCVVCKCILWISGSSSIMTIFRFYDDSKLNIHKIHLYATSNFNLIFHSQDIVWQQKIQYILCSKRDISLSVTYGWSVVFSMYSDFLQQ
jgi:hypothetical protein